MEELIEKASAYIEKLFADCLPKTMYFHNLEHTLSTLMAVREIGSHSGLDDQEKYILELSALFHDSGYIKKYIGHEEESMRIAADFLRQENVGQEVIDSVCGCILATRFPQLPTEKLGMILCDADLYHFSLDDYLLFAENLKREWEVMLKVYYDKQQWDALNLNLLCNHEYFSPYSRNKFQKGKELNIDRLSAI